jgi:hypothetical protein
MLPLDLAYSSAWLARDLQYLLYFEELDLEAEALHWTR